MPDPVPQENLEEADKVWEEFKLKLDKLDESLSHNDKLRQTEETAKTICNFVVAGGKINEKRKESLEGGKRLGSLGEYARLAEDEARKLSGKALTGGLKKEEWALLRGLYVLQGAAEVMGLEGMTPNGAKKKFIQVADDLEVLEDVGEGKTLLDESDVMVRAFERLKEEMVGRLENKGLKRQGVAPVAAEVRPEENRAGEVMRRVIGREAAPPPPETPGPPEGEAAPADGGGYSERYWFDELGADLPEGERDRTVTIGEIKWLLGRGAMDLETGEVLRWVERRMRGANGEEFDERNRMHVELGRKIAVRAARELFFGHDSETGLAWKTIPKPGSWRGVRMDILVPRIREILNLWGQVKGDLIEKEVFDQAWVAHEYFFWLRSIQYGQGDIRKQKALEESMPVDVNHYLTRLVEMVAEEQTIGGKGAWKERVETLMEREGIGVDEAVERLKGKGMELPRFAHIANKTDEFGQAAASKLFENRFINVFMKKGEVMTVWNESVGLLEGEELVKIATKKNDTGQFLYEGKTLAAIPVEVRDQVQQAREAVRRAIEFRGGVGDDGKIPGLDEIRVGQAYVCKNDNGYLIGMNDWLRQNVAMMRSVFGIPRVYTAGVYDAVLPESILPGGTRIHFKAKQRMPWRDQPPWARKWKLKQEIVGEGDEDAKRIDYVDLDTELLRDMKGEEGRSQRSRYAKALFDCPQGLTYLEYRRIKDRTDQVVTTFVSYTEDHIRKIQGFRSRIMYDLRLRLGTTWELPFYDAYKKGGEGAKWLFLREYGIRRDLPPRQKNVKRFASIPLRYIYPDTEKGKEDIFMEDMFGAWEDEVGIYDEQRLLNLGFSADRAREVSRVVAPRYEMVNRLQQALTDYFFTSKTMARRTMHTEALKVIGRGPEGMNEIARLLNEKRMAGWVFQQLFELAGITEAGWERIGDCSAEEKARLFLTLFTSEQLFWLFHYKGTPRENWMPQKWFDVLYVMGTRTEVVSHTYKGEEVSINEVGVLEQWQANVDAKRRGERVTLTRGMNKAEADWFIEKKNRLKLEAIDRLQRLKWRNTHSGEELIIGETGEIVGFGRAKRLTIKNPGEPDPSWLEDSPEYRQYRMQQQDYGNYMGMRNLLLYGRVAVLEEYDFDLGFPFVGLETAQDVMAIMDYIILRKYGFFDDLDEKLHPLYDIQWLNMAAILSREYRGEITFRHQVFRKEIYDEKRGEWVWEEVSNDHPIEDWVVKQIRERTRKRQGVELNLSPNGIEIPTEPQFRFQCADKFNSVTGEFEPYLFGQRGEDGKFIGNPIAEYESPRITKEGIKWQAGHLGISLSQGDWYSDRWIPDPRMDWSDSIAGPFGQAGVWIRALARFDWYVAKLQYGQRYEPWVYSQYMLTPSDWSARPGDEGRPRWPWKHFGFRIPGKDKQSFFFLALKPYEGRKILRENVVRGLQIVGGVTEEDAERFERRRFTEGEQDKEGEIGLKFVEMEAGGIVKNIPVVGEPLAYATKWIRWYPKSVLSLPSGLGVAIGTGAGLAIAGGLPFVSGIPVAIGGVAVAGGIVGLTVGTGIAHAVRSWTEIRKNLVAVERPMRDGVWDCGFKPADVFEQFFKNLIGGRM